MLDTLCPVDWTSATRIKKLCVLLVSGNTPYHDPHRQSLRRFAQESRYPHDKVSFMYVFQERQSQFINALTSGEFCQIIKSSNPEKIQVFLNVMSKKKKKKCP